MKDEVWISPSGKVLLFFVVTSPCGSGWVFVSTGAAPRVNRIFPRCVRPCLTPAVWGKTKGENWLIPQTQLLASIVLTPSPACFLTQ